ncbi:MAG: hypothetical protein AAF414_13800 [Pseudomonadota bacterium]
MTRFFQFAFATALMSLLLSFASAQEMPETIRGCTLLADATERLACFDNAFEPVSSDQAPLTHAIVGGLLVELGDPEFVAQGVNYMVAQNGYLVAELLVGSWANVSWETALSFYRRGNVGMVCRSPARVDIAADADDPFRLVATQARDGAISHFYDLVWRGGNSFVRVDNLGSWMDRTGIELEAGGWSRVGPLLERNGTAWTITPRSVDVMVATSPQSLQPEIYLRCPAS